MRNASRSVLLPTALLVSFVASAVLAGQSTPGREGLAGTSWRLVKFQGDEGTALKPADPSKYTVTFQPGGAVAVRIDCNRAKGTWKSDGPGRLQLGPLALTRAMCPAAALTERLPKDWPTVRRYTYDLREGRLFLSMAADGGIYEFEPRPGAQAAAEAESRVASIGPVEYDCSAGAASTDGLTATFYRTVPGLVLVRRGTETRPAFQARSASGARYVGEDLLFWDAHGEALVTWSGVELKCKPRPER